MPVTAAFSLAMARKALLGTDDPWSDNWQVVPLDDDPSTIDKGTVYADLHPVFAPLNVGTWSIQPYQEPGDPPPPEELLPYAYCASPAAQWTNEEEATLTIRALAVIAQNTITQDYDLLFWQAIEPPIVVPPGDTFVLENLRFAFGGLADA